MIERGVTPHLTRKELEDLGFNMIVCPLAALFAATRAVEGILTELRDEETTAGAYDRLIEFEEFGKLVGLDERYADEARYSQ
jgi:2-methylisocitrate lyase-like PEP mutase family enzyme